MKLEGYIFLAGVAFFCSCGGDTPYNSPQLYEEAVEKHSVPADNTDTTFTFGCTFQEHFDMPPYLYTRGMFNPVNANQIAYLRSGTQGFNRELWTFDFITGQGQCIASNILNWPQWSKQGWIIYTAADGDLYKIQGNGTSMTRLSYTGPFNSFPAWNPEGTEFLFLQDLEGPWFYIIADAEGNHLDTLEGGIQGSSWRYLDENNLVYIRFINGNYSNYGPAVYNIPNQTIQPIDAVVDPFLYGVDIGGLGLNPKNNSVVWGTDKMIASTNISSLERTIIRKGASNRKYAFVDVSFDGEYILFSRSNIRKYNECNGYFEQKLYIMKSDGTWERELILPGM